VEPLVQPEELPELALWVVPFFAVVAGVAFKRAAERLGSWMLSQKFYDLETGFMGMDHDEAVAVLDRIFTLNLSFMVFTFGSLLVAIQVAGGQYTPRIIATTLLRDNVIRWIVGFFVFSMLWANRTMVQMTANMVPQFQLFLSMMFGIDFDRVVSFIDRLFSKTAAAGEPRCANRQRRRQRRQGRLSKCHSHRGRAPAAGAKAQVELVAVGGPHHDANGAFRQKTWRSRAHCFTSEFVRNRAGGQHPGTACRSAARRLHC
jgi:hypothetical protein